MAKIHRKPEISFGRGICNRYEIASDLEWLVTNGIGGYAAGTVAGSLTRRYHGLLVASFEPPLKRTLLLAKLDETVHYLGESLPLFVNHWASGVIEPPGNHHLDQFHLEGSVPVWTYGVRDAQLQKRVWMAPGENTTYIRYDNLRASKPLILSLEAFLNFRDHHGNTRAGIIRFDIKSFPGGFEVRDVETDRLFFVYGAGAEISVDPEWSSGYFLKVEGYRGLDPIDDHLRGAKLEVSLEPGKSFTVITSTKKGLPADSTRSYAIRRNQDQTLLAAANELKGAAAGETWVQQLVLAADQFVVARPTLEDPNGRTIIAGYPWFSDWGRDTMISLPGLTLATGRPRVAGQILETYTRYVDQGMLPNQFPDDGEIPEYNTADATLWYFEAIRAYLWRTEDLKLVDSLYPTLQAIVDWHLDGTRYGIQVDADDGLLRAGEPGVQLTWMDVKIGDWVVTPRTGKPVDINALWYNALEAMVDFSTQLGKEASKYRELAACAKKGFLRFWVDSLGYCADVLDGPAGEDRSLRPNQLFAVSLPFSPFSWSQQKSIVDRCAQDLYISHGLRSLASADPAYIGTYGGDQSERDASYHQGAAWGWLIGPFLTAHWRVYQDRARVISYLQPLLENLNSHGVGTLSEIYEGNPPFTPRGCFAQAWTVGEVLRIGTQFHREGSSR